MAFWTAGAVGLLIAYLLGSVPTGHLAGKLLRGIDIRKVQLRQKAGGRDGLTRAS